MAHPTIATCLRPPWLRTQPGRFTQPDPIGLAGGLNLYGYAGGDPINSSDPFGLSVVFRGEQARQLWVALQQQVVAWALSDDEGEQARGTKLLSAMNRIYGAARIVEIGVDDAFGDGDPTENRTGPMDNGNLGINVSMRQRSHVGLHTKLAHEIGHAYAAIQLGMPLYRGMTAHETSAHQNVAVRYENLYRRLAGCGRVPGWIVADPRCR